MREDGYYWIKADGVWVIGYWNKEGWGYRWSDGKVDFMAKWVKDSELDEIDERRIIKD